jgi:hypothetical protein
MSIFLFYCLTFDTFDTVSVLFLIIFKLFKEINKDIKSKYIWKVKKDKDQLRNLLLEEKIWIHC